MRAACSRCATARRACPRTRWQDPVAHRRLLLETVGRLRSQEVRAQFSESGGLVLVAPEVIKRGVVGFERCAERFH